MGRTPPPPPGCDSLSDQGVSRNGPWERLACKKYAGKGDNSTSHILLGVTFDQPTSHPRGREVGLAIILC